MNVDEVRLMVEPYRNKLADFGTAHEIRDFLVEQEVRAINSDQSSSPSSTCALAVYMQRETGHPFTVGLVCMSVKNPTPCGYYVDLGQHTDAMREFISNFDRGDYPELEIR